LDSALQATATSATAMAARAPRPNDEAPNETPNETTTRGMIAVE